MDPNMNTNPNMNSNHNPNMNADPNPNMNSNPNPNMNANPNTNANANANANTIIVQETPSDFRALARMALKGLWGKAFVGVIIYEAMMVLLPGIVELFFPSTRISYPLPMSEEMSAYGVDMEYTVTFSSVTSIYQLLLAGPIIIGFTKFLLLIVRRREVSNESLFKGFEHFGKAFLLQFLIGILSALWVMPVAIFGSTLTLLNPLFSVLMTFGTAAIAIWVYFRYFMATYFMADDWNLSPMECIRLSKEKIKGNYWSLIKLHLSFVGWALVAALLETSILNLIPLNNSAVVLIMSFISRLPYFAVMLYLRTATSFFYEIMTGHLRKQEPIQPFRAAL